jgi:hypothetical protein
MSWGCRADISNKNIHPQYILNNQLEARKIMRTSTFISTSPQYDASAITQPVESQSKSIATANQSSSSDIFTPHRPKAGGNTMRLTLLSLLAARVAATQAATSETAICPNNFGPVYDPVPVGTPRIMLNKYEAIQGSRKVGDNLDIMAVALPKGEFDPEGFQKVLPEYSARKIHAAMNSASFCGDGTNNIAHSLKQCLTDTLDSAKGATSNIPTFHTRLASKDEAAEINTVRLAFAEIFAPYMTDTHTRQIAPVELVTDLPPGVAGVTMHSQLEDHRRHVFIAGGKDRERNMATAMHELLHANVHKNWKIHKIISYGYAWEAITEYLATYEFTKNTLDSNYEVGMRSHEFGMEVAKTLGEMETGKLNAESEAVGVEIMKQAYLGGEIQSIHMVLTATKVVSKSMGVEI